mgnify:CR=1 FL=1
MYKEFIKNKKRIQTNKGLLSAEQLWDLSQPDLDALAVSLDEAYKNSKGKSFLEKKTAKDKDIKEALDIVLDVLYTKQEEIDAAKESAETKRHNDKILNLIATKREEALANKSEKELMAMLIK